MRGLRTKTRTSTIRHHGPAGTRFAGPPHPRGVLRGTQTHPCIHPPSPCPDLASTTLSMGRSARPLDTEPHTHVPTRRRTQRTPAATWTTSRTPRHAHARGDAMQQPGNIPEFYLPAEVAKMLRCSEWWVKEQARRGRIPFCWIGGGYRFLPEHLTEIVQMFERRTGGPSPTPPASAPRRKTGRTAIRRSGTSTQPADLMARVPPRARRVLPSSAEAA